MEYKYETHVHTMEASACADVCGAMQARIYKELGYTGIIITDHFFGGNTCVPRNLPWEDRIQLFCKGFENAKKEGDIIGINVFFGMEMGFRGKDFLVYGLSKEWLLSHPEIMEWTIEEQFSNVQAEGGAVVHAHPFREAGKGKAKLFPKSIHAVEVYNLENDRRNPMANPLAFEYAKEYHLNITGGGDAHHPNSCRGGIILENKLMDIKDYIRLLREGSNYKIIGEE